MLRQCADETSASGEYDVVVTEDGID
jgi:hypothetical protein